MSYIKAFCMEIASYVATWTLFLLDDNKIGVLALLAPVLMLI